MNPIGIDKVLTDTRLLGAALGDIATWSTWIVALKAAFALPLDDNERATFKSIAGDRALPSKRVRELWCVAGRRSGKSRMAAALAIFFALFVLHKLARGEKGLVLVLAMTVDQAKVVFDYVVGFLRASDALSKEIETITRSEIRLKNGITIAVHPNSFRSVRGRTLCACIFDEVRDDTTATPDAETYTAVLPALLTTKGMLIGISSPYRRMGLLHAKHKRHYGVDSDDTLVVQGSTLTFNRTIDSTAIDAQQEADPAAARSEWNAEFRDDIAGFLDDALIEQAIDRDRPLELPPRDGYSFKAYCDASGGAIGGDAYTFAIAHCEDDDRHVIDLVRGRAGPFDPETLTKEYAELCKEYRIDSVMGDKYGKEWVSSAWRKAGIAYTPSEITASDTYLEALPLWTRGAVRIPDHPTLVRELRLLERTPTRMGKDQVTHPRGVHDDYANVVFGALYTGRNRYKYDSDLNFVRGPDSNPDDAAVRFQETRFARHIRQYSGYYNRRW
jgi:hypothetical protein